MRKNAHGVIVKGKAVEDQIEEWLRIWKRDKPWEFQEYLELLQREYQSLWTPSGMSRDRTMAYRGMIPQDLFIMIEATFPNYLKDPKNLMRVHRQVMGDFRPRPGRNFHVIERPPDA